MQKAQTFSQSSLKASRKLQYFLLSKQVVYCFMEISNLSGLYIFNPVLSLIVIKQSTNDDITRKKVSPLLRLFIRI